MEWHSPWIVQMVTLLIFESVWEVSASTDKHSYKTVKMKRWPTMAAGFSGTSSSRSLLSCANYCSSDNNCLSAVYCTEHGQGQCSSYTATTNNMFVGLQNDETCTYMEIGKACQNGGTLMDKEGRCSCLPLYTGSACETERCPISEGYVLENGRCFKFYESPKKTHADAQSFCQTEASHLFTIESVNDANILMNVVSAGAGILNWVDGNDDSTWDNQPLPYTTYVSHTASMCTALCQQDEGLESWDCAKEYGYFCQLDI